MRQYPKSPPRVTLAVLAAGLVARRLQRKHAELQPAELRRQQHGHPAAAAAGAERYAVQICPEEFVGRWGFTSYHKEADRARTVNTARGLCRSPYVIAKGPSGGVMMHLADERQPTELRLKGSPEARTTSGRTAKPAVAQDREIVSFDGRVLITRYIDPDAAQPLRQHGLRALRAAGVTAGASVSPAGRHGGHRSGVTNAR